MPNRYLRESILSSEAVNRLQPHAELFYRRLMSVVDDYGRIEANPKLLRASCYPLRVDEVREADISRWLTEVESAGLIVLYAVNAKNYLEFLKLGEPRAKSSKYPPPLTHERTCAQEKTSAPPSIAPSITVTTREEPPLACATAAGIDPADRLAGETGLDVNTGPKQLGKLRALIAIDGYDAARDGIRRAMAKGIGGPAAISWAESNVAGTRGKRELREQGSAGAVREDK